MGNRAHYRIVGETDYALIIEDLGPWDYHMTVTNDAAGVVAELATELAGRRLFYFDSVGALDEITHQRGKFTGFRCMDPMAGAAHDTEKLRCAR